MRHLHTLMACTFLHVIGSHGDHILYSGNLLWEKIFVDQAILFSEEIFVIFDFNLPGDF